MAGTDAAVARRNRGRPLGPRTGRVVLPKAKCTISIDQELDRAFRLRAERDGATFSGLVEEAMRQALALAVAS